MPSLPNKHNPKIVPTAKMLRKNMTREEKHLWYDFLRTHPIRFVRQKVLGDYIADFYAAAVNLVVEVDGAQHRSEIGKDRDSVRTSYLSNYGIHVLRISNFKINHNFIGACAEIDRMIQTLQNEGDFHGPR